LNKATRDKVLSRDEGSCWHCGELEAISIQHRQNRGMGGSKLQDRLDNLIVLCSVLNCAIESDAVQADYARDHGWKLNSWDDYSSPVFRAETVKWYQLGIKGELTQVDAPSWLI
jgi:hypothetical protein